MYSLLQLCAQEVWVSGQNLSRQADARALRVGSV
jgi:hypothetical protein